MRLAGPVATNVQIVGACLLTRSPYHRDYFRGRFLVLIPFRQVFNIAEIRTTGKGASASGWWKYTSKNFRVIGVLRHTEEGSVWPGLIVKAEDSSPQMFGRILWPMHGVLLRSLFSRKRHYGVDVLRDVFRCVVLNIYVNDAETFGQIFKICKSDCSRAAGDCKTHAKDEPIFDHFNVTKQIRNHRFGKDGIVFARRIRIIEHTGRSTSLMSTPAIARACKRPGEQCSEGKSACRRRNRAPATSRAIWIGIMVIDFIDMNKAEHRQTLYDHMREVMANDRARHNIPAS